MSRIDDYLLSGSIDKELHSIKKEFDHLKEKNSEYLKRVSEWNKNEEIEKAKSNTRSVVTHSLHIFSDNELERVKNFRAKHYASCKNGGHYIYDLAGTGIGVITTIKCPVCGEKLDVTDYDCW